MKIVYVYADTPDEWNCSEWRCAVPARAINLTGQHSAELISIKDFGHNTPVAQAACRTADVIVIQRCLFGPVLSKIQHWKARDKVIIADFDDAFDLMHPTNVSYPFWNRGLIDPPGEEPQTMDPPPLTQFKWGLRLVHAATVPSRRLADDWQSYTQVHYLPNYVDLKIFENATPEAHEGIVIGWGGSLSHLQSFTDSGVIPALQRVCEARPQVRVMICGSDQRILEHIPIPEKQLIHEPWRPYSEWSQNLVKFDIGLAPLSGPYDQRRSWIKVLEYLLMKIPWVASEGPAYQDLRPYGWLVRNTSQAWERVLLDMVDHIEDYKQEAAGEPYLFGISQNVYENVDKIISTYASIYERAIGGNHQPAAERFDQFAPNWG